MAGSTSGGHSLNTPRYWNERDVCRFKQKKYLPATQISASSGTGLRLDLFHSPHRSCIATVIFAMATTGSGLLKLDKKKLGRFQRFKELPIFWAFRLETLD
jgi:hypothetical protein